MVNKKLSINQAYDAMFDFLEEHYNALQGDEVGSLLGSMSLMEDRKPLDPALWETWERCVAKALKGQVKSGLVLNPKSSSLR